MSSRISTLITIEANFWVRSPHIVERLIYNSGGTHGKHTAQEDAVHPSPVETVAHADAQHHHGEDDDDGGDDGDAPIFTIFLKEKSRPSEKSVKMTPDVCPGLDVRLVHYRHGVGHVGRNEEACHDVSQHQGLLEPLEDEGNNACHHQDEGEVFLLNREFLPYIFSL